MTIYSVLQTDVNVSRGGFVQISSHHLSFTVYLSLYICVSKPNQIVVKQHYFFCTLPSSGIAPYVGTTWKWYRRHTLALPCSSRAGVIWGRTSGSEVDAYY